MKRIASYFTVSVFLVLILSFATLVFGAQEASTIMCDNGVVNIGDMDVDVQDKCGQPNSQTMNQWVYKFGPSQPVYTVIFNEGQVVKILEDEWGS